MSFWFEEILVEPSYTVLSGLNASTVKAREKLAEVQASEGLGGRDPWPLAEDGPWEKV